jgi:hypothetical protein
MKNTLKYNRNHTFKQAILYGELLGEQKNLREDLKNIIQYI